jgi:hypothetical protein
LDFYNSIMQRHSNRVGLVGGMQLTGRILNMLIHGPLGDAQDFPDLPGRFAMRRAMTNPSKLS